MSISLDDFAASIGVQLPQDENLMSIVEQLFSSGLPEGWTQHHSSKGSVYYYNEALDFNQIEDPRVTEGRRRIMDKRRSASGDSAGSKQQSLPFSRAYTTVSPEEIKDLARHYGVNPRLEYHMLHLVRSAVLTPLPSVWQECLDSTGRPYFYNAAMDQSSRRHPVDSHFMPLIDSLRGSVGSSGSPVMAFETRSVSDEESISWVYYDFRSDALLSKRPADLPIGCEQQQAQADAEAAITDLSAGSSPDGHLAVGTGDDRRSGKHSPRALQIQNFLHQVRQDINAQVNQYKTQNLSSRIMDDAKFVKPSKKQQKSEPYPRELVFYSWWFEEGVRRYLELRYDMKAKVRRPPLYRFFCNTRAAFAKPLRPRRVQLLTRGRQAFRIVLDKAVVLSDVKIAGRGGTLLDCFDLFVGQRIDVLGKPTTLLQANFETLEWLEYHAEKSLQQARALEIEIAKFKTTIASVTELAKKRSNGRGTHNLRWIASKIEFLKKELLQHKPARASSPDSVASEDSAGLSGLDPRFLEESP